MNKVNPNVKKAVIRLAITTALSLIVIVFIQLQIRSISQEISDSKAQVQVANSKGTNNAKLQGQYKQLQGDIKKLDSVLLVSQADLLAFIDYVEKTAGSAGFTAELAFSQESGSSDQSASSSKPRRDFTVKVSGSVDQINIFLNELKKGPYYVEIRGFELGSSSDLRENATASFKASVYQANEN